MTIDQRAGRGLEFIEEVSADSLETGPRGVAVLTHCPVKAEIAGSNPVGVAIKLVQICQQYHTIFNLK